MKQRYILGLLLCCCTMQVYTQQDPMFTKYAFNSLIFNPAYAGSNEHLAVHLIHRSQWIGFEGAPVTQSLSAHTPLKNERVGVGMSLVNDKIGAGGTFDANLSYSYKIISGDQWSLAAGLQAGMTNWRGNWSKLVLEHPTDVAFSSDLNRFLPNFGAGLYLHSERFYVGMGCPRIIEYDLRQSDNAGSALNAHTYRHYYTTAGIVLPLMTENIIFKPTILIKTTGVLSSLRRNPAQRNLGAPTEIDLDASFFFYKTLWVGAAYRTALQWSSSSDDSADLWMAYYLRNGIRFGAAYDFTLSSIRKGSKGGSFELMLGYEFDIKVKKVTTPRYF